MGKVLQTKKHKTICIRLERVNFPQRTKGLTSFSSIGPGLIWLVANGVFIKKAWDICDKCEDYHMSYKELIVCERCSPSDTQVRCTLAAGSSITISLNYQPVHQNIM